VKDTKRPFINPEPREEPPHPPTRIVVGGGARKRLPEKNKTEAKKLVLLGNTGVDFLVLSGYFWHRPVIEASKKLDLF